jgi:NADH-quinone oxidoreductase subunit C
MSLTPEIVTEKLKAAFGESVLSAEMLYDFLTVTVKKQDLFQVISFLKNDEQINCHFLTTLCGLHYPDQAEPFGLMVQLHNMSANFRIRIKAFTGDAEPHFKTLTTLWPSTNWMEREAYDFYGFKFDGHPDMRRILNTDSLVGWPLRKEYPLEDPFRLDKDDKMFGRQ